jgi:hypothetical protein
MIIKPFLGTDISEDKKSEKINGSEFLAVKPSEALQGAFDSAVDSACRTQESAKLPKPLRVIKWICGAAAAIIVVAVAKAFARGDVTFSQAYLNAPYLFWIGGICLVVWAVLFFASSRKETAVLESDEGSYSIQKLDSMVGTVLAELGVPQDAKSVDILKFKYVVKNEEIKPKLATAFDRTQYENSEFKIFSDESSLCFADVYGKYEIPLEELVGIRTVNKRISVSVWNKETPPTKGEFKQFKLKTNDYGDVFFKPYYILEFNHNGERWGIYFANYDLPAYEEATGLKAQ